MVGGWNGEKIMMINMAKMCHDENYGKNPNTFSCKTGIYSRMMPLF